MRVLVTNDDGIDAPGLLVLARCAAEQGWEVVVAAPETEASGTSAGLTAAAADRRVAVADRTLPELPGTPAHAVAAHPGLIALSACHGAFGPPPDLVLSGVNLGANIGRQILHSGTAGAALTASINDTRAAAISLDVPLHPVEPPHWDTAAAVLRDLLPLVAEQEPGRLVNINIPDRELADVGPARWAGLARVGQVRSRVVRSAEGQIEVGSALVDDELEPGTDAALLLAGHVTVSPVRSVHDAEAPHWILPETWA
ncbi:5'/3'-nucleotidase SurE [Actinokineospora bangkokensis]|uniref:5'-nucleotidase n=2 Tax=Actinokineospora bangkokensis TaxID=1193682 RepID=A0A1Q9LL39_9PSEU|nr:5'/3'-nucleotidase SurE [Actinokineospora bangkokensis]